MSQDQLLTNKSESDLEDDSAFKRVHDKSSGQSNSYFSQAWKGLCFVPLAIGVSYLCYSLSTSPSEGDKYLKSAVVDEFDPETSLAGSIDPIVNDQWLMEYNETGRYATRPGKTHMDRAESILPDSSDVLTPHFLPKLVYPGDNCINLYTDTYYRGKVTTLCLEPDQKEMTWFALNNREIEDTYSIWSGASLRFKMTNGDGDEGYNYIQTGAGNNQVYRISNSIKGDLQVLTVNHYDPVVEGYITVYSGENCGGNSGAFEAPKKVKTSAFYNSETMQERGIDWNDAESVRVPYGYDVSLFYYDAFQGFEFKVEGGMFLDRDYRMTCINLILDDDEGNKYAGSWWDNVATSLIVTKSVSLGSAVGRWEQIYSTEPFEHTLQVGSSFEKKQGVETAFSLGLDIGIEFDSIDLGMSASSSITRSTEQLYRTTKSESITVSCGHDSKEKGFGLYQWVIEDASGKNSVWHNVYYCKIGDGANIPPQCPPDICINADCSQCDDTWKSSSE